ncbi:MAG TPA: hypothetical protein PKZ01_10545, partial [Candidatus Hydrogenedentes bacterium]|nr:hypothetical protein [Candidatus Hydrogenedentota bacterium]
RRVLRVLLAVGAAAICCVAEAQEPAPGAGDALATSIKQTQIKVWFIETSEQGLRDLGTNLTYTRYVRGEARNGAVGRVTSNLFSPTSNSYRVTLPAPVTDPSDPSFTGVPNVPPSGTVLRPDLHPPLSDGIQAQNGAGLTFDIVDSRHGSIDGVFRSIETKTDSDLVSKPELLVRDGQEALVHAGGQFPFQDISYPNGRATLNVAWRDLGVTMRLNAQSIADNLVQINIGQLDVSDIARVQRLRGIDLPVFSTRSQSGLVVVPSGQTLVIGGLTSSVVNRTENRVPLLGAIPLVGIPFRSRRTEPTKSHLLVFISPTVVDLRNLDSEANNALNFWQSEGWKHTEGFRKEIQIMQSGG